MNKLYGLFIAICLCAIISPISNVKADEAAYQDCINFYGVGPEHPKYYDIVKTCKEVTNTMDEWQALKAALCVSTPNDPKCK